MTSKRKKRKLDLLSLAMWGAGLTTLIAIFGTAYLAIADSEFAETVQRGTLLLMLVSYLFFIAVVISRKKKVVPLMLTEKSDSVIVLPAKASQVFIIEREMIDWYASANSIPQNKLVQNRNVRIVIARELDLTARFTELLDWFPDISVLDIQGSTVSDEVWESLLEFDHLQHVFVANTVTQQSLGVVGMTLPDVRLWTEPRRVVPVDGSR